jgi:DNA ligase (NAD+)
MRRQHYLSTLHHTLDIIVNKKRHGSRDQVRDLISATGGRVTSIVSRKTDYVLASPESGSKFDQAQRLGVPIINEAQLYEVL